MYATIFNDSAGMKFIVSCRERVNNLVISAWRSPKVTLSVEKALSFLSFVLVAWMSRPLIHIQVPQQGLGFVSMWVCGFVFAAGSDVELRYMILDRHPVPTHLPRGSFTSQTT